MIRSTGDSSLYVSALASPLSLRSSSVRAASEVSPPPERTKRLRICRFRFLVFFLCLSPWFGLPRLIASTVQVDEQDDPIDSTTPRAVSKDSYGSDDDDDSLPDVPIEKVRSNAER